MLKRVEVLETTVERLFLELGQYVNDMDQVFKGIDEELKALKGEEELSEW